MPWSKLLYRGACKGSWNPDLRATRLHTRSFDHGSNSFYANPMPGHALPKGHDRSDWTPSLGLQQYRTPRFPPRCLRVPADVNKTNPRNCDLPRICCPVQLPLCLSVSIYVSIRTAKCVCVCVCMCACMCIYLPITYPPHPRTYPPTDIYIYIYISVSVSIFIYISLYYPQY